jgi:hypothetical protein
MMLNDYKEALIPLEEMEKSMDEFQGIILILGWLYLILSGASTKHMLIIEAFIIYLMMYIGFEGGFSNIVMIISISSFGAIIISLMFYNSRRKEEPTFTLNDSFFTNTDILKIWDFIKQSIVQSIKRK